MLRKEALTSFYCAGKIAGKLAGELGFEPRSPVLETGSLTVELTPLWENKQPRLEAMKPGHSV
jgi:hypothetical protein